MKCKSFCPRMLNILVDSILQYVGVISINCTNIVSSFSRIFLPILKYALLLLWTLTLKAGPKVR